MPRTIVIGDVHGCLDEFQALVRLVSCKPQDRVIQVGDLMDRGPDPAGCVRFARERGFEILRGNHEDKHLRWRQHEQTRGAKKNPVHMPEIRAEQNRALTDEDLEWLARAPLMIDLGNQFVAVHAGLEPAFPIAQQSSAVTRIRYVDDGTRGKLDKMVSLTERDLDKPANSVFWATRWRGPESVVYGHAAMSLETPRIDAFDGGACFAIDTGCVFGGRLTAMVLVPGAAVEFAQVQARTVYYEGFRPTRL